MKHSTRQFITVMIALLLFIFAMAISTKYAESAELTEIQITEYVEEEAACYALAKAAGNEYHQSRHLFNLKEHLSAYKFTIIHTIGYTEGYLAAVSYVTKTSEPILAARQHKRFCLEKS